MQANLDRLGGLVHSQRVLLALTQAGVSREDAYAVGPAQRDAGLGGQGQLPVAAEERPGSDSGDPGNGLEALFDVAPHVAHVDTIFQRVFRRKTAEGEAD